MTFIEHFNKENFYEKGFIISIRIGTICVM